MICLWFEQRTQDSRTLQTSSLVGRFIPIVTPEEVARAVKTALTRESSMVVVPWLMDAFLKLNQVLPRLAEWLVVSNGYKRKA